MKKILVIEDDCRVAAALTARLRTAGYEVFSAPDPGHATIVAAMQSPDLIVTDIWMPVMQGLTFVRRLGSLGLGRPPVIFMTASRADGLWESAMEMGAAAYFEKPYDPQRLLAAISEALAHRTSGPAQTVTP
jgi:DNA-binding response OmpR family regulator